MMESELSRESIEDIVMTFVCNRVPTNETEKLVSILLPAEEGEERIRAELLHPGTSAYSAMVDEVLIGAASVRWQDDELSEIIYIAIKPEWSGKGYGKRFIAYLIDELRARRGSVLLVGTANTSLSNIAFYQKCGFRMFEVRRDYFDYIQPPIFESGIRIRDMIVLRYQAE